MLSYPADSVTYSDPYGEANPSERAELQHQENIHEDAETRDQRDQGNLEEGEHLMLEQQYQRSPFK